MASKFTLELGEKAPAFKLKGTDERVWSLDDFKDKKGIVIFFTCNHCPYVKGSDEVTRKTAEKFNSKGIAFIGINSNSEQSYPEDSYDLMVQRMQTYKFPWIYLHDPHQEMALKYGALRTPHFYLFDQDRKLIYTGRAIDNPKDPSKATINDLENALSEFVTGKPISKPLTNPLGCNVKWEGKDKHWMPEEACDLAQ